MFDSQKTQFRNLLSKPRLVFLNFSFEEKRNKNRQIFEKKIENNCKQ